MAFVFHSKPVATIKAKDSSSSTTTFTINGVTTDVTTPDAAAEQINKLYNIGGLSVKPDGMLHIEQKEAVDNG